MAAAADLNPFGNIGVKELSTRSTVQIHSY